MRRYDVSRSWSIGLLAVLVAVTAAACASGPDGSSPTADEPDELRVDVQWRVDLAGDRGWELDPREMGRPVLTPRGDLIVGATDGWLHRIEGHSGDVRWSTPVGGSIDAAARLADGTVYVGSDAGELVAVDWRTGAEQWRHETAGSVESRPTAEAGRIFVTDSEDRLYAVDAASGERLWTYQSDEPDFFTIKGGGQPLVEDDVVYCGFADGNLTALHADSGDEIWSTHLGDETGEFGDVDLPLFDRGEELVATSHAGGIYSIDKETGTVGWHVERSDISGVEFESGWLFASTATGDVLAVDTREGDVAWEYELPSEYTAMDVGLTGPFVAVATGQGPMYWLEMTSGTPVTGWLPSTGFQSAPVFAEGQGYVMSNRGYLYGFGLAF